MLSRYDEQRMQISSQPIINQAVAIYDPTNISDQNSQQDKRVLRYSEIEPFLKRRAQNEEQKFQELLIKKAKENKVSLYERRESPRGSHERRS